MYGSHVESILNHLSSAGLLQNILVQIFTMEPFDLSLARFESGRLYAVEDAITWITCVNLESGIRIR